MLFRSREEVHAKLVERQPELERQQLEVLTLLRDLETADTTQLEALMQQNADGVTAPPPVGIKYRTTASGFDV